MASILRLGLIVAALALLRAPSVGEETPPRWAQWMRDEVAMRKLEWRNGPQPNAEVQRPLRVQCH